MGLEQQQQHQLDGQEQSLSKNSEQNNEQEAESQLNVMHQIWSKNIP